VVRLRVKPVQVVRAVGVSSSPPTGGEGSDGRGERFRVEGGDCSYG
jgi:hypothetical protein